LITAVGIEPTEETSEDEDEIETILVSVEECERNFNFLSTLDFDADQTSAVEDDVIVSEFDSSLTMPNEGEQFRAEDDSPSHEEALLLGPGDETEVDPDGENP
jgi:hypothetical protein